MGKERIAFQIKVWPVQKAGREKYSAIEGLKSNMFETKLKRKHS
jgi:hypothetical protein